MTIPSTTRSMSTMPKKIFVDAAGLRAVAFIIPRAKIAIKIVGTAKAAPMAKYTSVFSIIINYHYN